MSKRKPKPMTARKFVLESHKCPVCRSEHIEWGSHTVEWNSTYQEARCLGCGLGFNTISRLVGYMVEPGWEAVTIAEDFGAIEEAEPAKDDPLVIEVRGGCVQVHKPQTLPGLRVVIRDYAVQGVDETVLTKDSEGRECQEFVL